MIRLVTYALALALISSSPILAQTQISEQQATTSVPTIQLQVNKGLNLMLPPGVRAYRGWLDDDNFVEIDSDRDLAKGATVIHLVARQPGQSQLTLVVQDQEGFESLYVFKLVVGDTGASIVNVTAHPSPSGVVPGRQTDSQFVSRESSESGKAFVFQQGIQLAISRGLIVPNSELHRKLQEFTEKVEQGVLVEEAANRIGLKIQTIEQLFKLGQISPDKPPIPAEEETLVKYPKTQPDLVVDKQGVQTPKSNQSVVVVAQEDSALAERIVELEDRVNRLDQKMTALDTQQEDFLAQLEQISGQQEMLLTQVQSIELSGNNPKYRPIQLSIQTSDNPSEDSDTESEVSGQSGERLSNHKIANAISNSLLTHPDTPYQGWLYRHFQSFIRKLRAGYEPISAVHASGLRVEEVKSVLEHVGVDPSEAGIN